MPETVGAYSAQPGTASRRRHHRGDPGGAQPPVRRLRPDVVMVARARDARHARRLYELGATDAVPETIEASLQLSEAVLVDLGVPMGFVIASIHEKRDEIRKSLNVSGERQDPPETAEGAEKPRRTLRGRAGRTRSAPSTEG